MNIKTEIIEIMRLKEDPFVLNLLSKQSLVKNHYQMEIIIKWVYIVGIVHGVGIKYQKILS